MNGESKASLVTIPSELTKTLLLFTWVDYSLFCVMFGLSAAIGIYYGCFGSKQATTKDYLLAGKKMKTFPIAVSLMASNFSGISLMGIPSEVYMHGTQYVMSILSLAVIAIITSQMYLPVFYKLQLTSVYEYLKLRFSNRIKMVASALFIFMNILYIPIVIYVPALAFNQVTGIDLHLITPIISSICIFYTALGGLKAVVWTDTLQFSVTLLTISFVLIMGMIKIGGVENVWQISQANDRLEFFNMDFDPTLRQSFWSVVIGNIVGWTAIISCNPVCIQRYMAVPTLTNAKRSLYIFVVGSIISKIILCFSGLIMYAKYHDCDPLSTGGIKKSDQILPYYVMDVANEIPGISGLFVAGVFSTALSTLSTYLNSLAGIFYTDFMLPFMPTNTSEAKASTIMKINVVVMGFVCVGMIFVIEKLGSVIELTSRLGAITSAPILGLFTLGMLFPMANEKGAICGGLGSLVFVSWVAIKTQLHAYFGSMKLIPKPLHTYGCKPNFNTTYIAESFTTTADTPCLTDEPFWLFRVTFYYSYLIGTVTCVAIGLLVSWITKSENSVPVDPDLLCPFVRKFVQKSNKTMSYTSIENGLKVIAANEKEVQVK